MCTLTEKIFIFAKSSGMLEDFKLKIFLTLIDKRSFTKTASVLGVTQPAVSQSISELEKTLGTRLFDRQRGEISLTPAGEIFKMYAQEILDRYAEATMLFAPLQPAVVNVYASDEVYEYMKSLSSKSVDIIILKGCNHGNGMYKQTKAYQTAIKKFIKKVLK